MLHPCEPACVLVNCTNTLPNTFLYLGEHQNCSYRLLRHSRMSVWLLLALAFRHFIFPSLPLKFVFSEELGVVQLDVERIFANEVRLGPIPEQFGRSPCAGCSPHPW